jgi:hypothetical protein
MKYLKVTLLILEGHIITDASALQHTPAFERELEERGAGIKTFQKKKSSAK